MVREPRRSRGDSSNTGTRRDPTGPTKDTLSPHLLPCTCEALHSYTDFARGLQPPPSAYATRSTSVVTHEGRRLSPTEVNAMGERRRVRQFAGVAAVAIAGMVAGCGGADDERPPAAAEGSIRTVAAAIAPCVEDPQETMAGVSVAQSEDDPNEMVVTLEDGAAFSVIDGASQPEAVNAQAESLLATCP